MNIRRLEVRDTKTGLHYTVYDMTHPIVIDEGGTMHVHGTVLLPPELGSFPGPQFQNAAPPADGFQNTYRDWSQDDRRTP